MQKHLLSASLILPLRAPKFWVVFSFLLGVASGAQAQLSGPYTIGPAQPYTTVAAAIAALNTQGVGSGGVVFNIPAGHTETFGSATAGRIQLLANASSAGNPVVFQKSGAGTNPKITTGTGASSTTVDAIISLNGTDYVTFDGLDLLDPASNSTQALQMEMGYALFRTGSGATADGCQNNVIRNCNVVLQKPYNTTGDVTGIFGANSTSANLTALSLSGLTSAALNSGNAFVNNTLENMNRGLVLLGIPDTGGGNPLYDQNNNVGGSTSGTPGVGGTGSGNLIRNINSIASGTSIYGTLTDYQNNLSVRYNTIDNAAGTGGTAAIRQVRAMAVENGLSGTLNLSNNRFTLSNNASTEVRGVNIQGPTGLTLTTNNNTFTVATVASTSPAVNVFFLTTAQASWTANANVWDNSGITFGTTGSVYFVNASTATPTLNFTNNTVTNLTRTGAGSIWGFANTGGPTSGTATLTGNTISNITVTGNSTLIGIEYRPSASGQTILIGASGAGNGNIISNIIGANGRSEYGIVADNLTSGSAIVNNTISTLGTTVGSGTGVGAYGIYVGVPGAATSTSAAVVVTGNTIGSLAVNGNSNSVGIQVNGGASTAVTVSQNTISGVSGTSSGGIAGVIVENGTTINVNQNSVNTLSANNSGVIPNGLRVNAGTTINVDQNIVNTITNGNSGGKIEGIRFGGGTTVNVTRNKIYDLSITSTSTGTGAYVYGIHALAGTTFNVSNNLIGNLTTTNATNTNCVIGINASVAGAWNIYYNTINLTAGGGSGMGSSGIFMPGTSGAIDLRNNIIVNTSAPAGSGIQAVLRASAASATAAMVNGSSNNNLYYVGIGSATRLIYSDGTNPRQTVPAYKTAVGPTKESNTVTESGIPPFASTTGSASNYLHFNPGAATNAESGGVSISVTNDYDDDTRFGSPGSLSTGTAPDIGADEFGPVAVDMLPTVLVAPATSGCYAANQTVTVRIQNIGTATQNFATNPTTVTVTVTGATSQILTATVNTGTLAPTATLDVTLTGTLNMSNVGVYTFAMSTSAANDGNRSNDVLSSNRTRSTNLTPAATLVVGPVCIGSAATLSGTLTGTAPWSLTYTTNGGSPVTVSGIASSPYSIATAILNSSATFEITALSSATCTATTLPATVTVTPLTTATWTGANTNWFDASNWSNGCTPSQAISAVIPNGLTNYPNLTTGSAVANNLSIGTTGSGTAAVLTISNAAASLDLKGDLTSSGLTSVQATAGTIVFSGTAAQNIGAGRFFNVVISGSGAIAKVLAADIEVAGNFDLSAGMLTESNFELRLTGISSAFVGASATHFVVQNGSGRLRIDNLGTGGGTRASAFYPIGTSTAAADYTPATLTNSGTTDFFIGSVANGITAGAAPSSNVVNKTWDISEGVALGSNATLTLQWNAANELTPLNRAMVDIAHYTGGAWAATCYTCYGAASGTGPYTVTRSGFTSFSPFAVQDASKPLPVELSRFTATRQGADAKLSWATASEKNNVGFGVEVSTDGREFRQLGFLAGAGSSTAPQAYAYTDSEKGKASTRYYRLRQLDLDGTASYSPVRTMDFRLASETRLSAAPNPFGGQVTLHLLLPAPTAGAVLTVSDATGRLVRQQTLNLPAGQTQVELTKLEALPSGIYFLNLEAGSLTQHLKVVKQ